MISIADFSAPTLGARLSTGATRSTDPALDSQKQ